jgi:hypothetical protein
MARQKKPAVPNEPDAELLPPRKALSLLSTDPAAYTGLLGDPTAGVDPAAPAADPGTAASSTADSAQDLVDAQASGSSEETVSDQPQTITRDDSQTASSET